jgi:hypothetical protein
MSFDLYSMERGELCHGQYRGLLLADYMQDIDAAKSNARGAVVRALDLSPGFGDYGMGFMLLKATVNPE